MQQKEKTLGNLRLAPALQIPKYHTAVDIHCQPGGYHTEFLPGLAESFDPEGSGMHQTATVDFDVIVSGELWLELDDGELRHLRAGDIVIQNGTRHAWRNRSEAPAVMLAVLVGARRTG